MNKLMNSFILIACLVASSFGETVTFENWKALGFNDYSSTVNTAVISTNGITFSVTATTSGLLNLNAAGNLMGVGGDIRFSPGESLQLSLAVSGTELGNLSLNNITFAYFVGGSDTAAFSDGSTTNTVTSSMSSASYSDHLAGLTELTKENVSTWQLNMDALDPSLFCVSSLTLDYLPQQPPVANDETYTLMANSIFTNAAPGILTNDTDENNDLLTAIQITSPANGTLVSFSTNGAFVYQPNAGYSGTDSFTYWANDGISNSNPATVTLTIEPPVVDPAAPVGLVATPGNGGIFLDWDDNVESDLASYNVYRTTTPGSYGAVLTNIAVNAFTDADVTNTTYYYVITAVDESAHESPVSGEVSATPAFYAVEYVIWEQDDLRFLLKADETDNPPIYINGIRADDPETPELDSFSQLSIFRRNSDGYMVQIAFYKFSGVNYFRTNLGGLLGSHYQFMPLISTLDGVIRQDGDVAERIDIWTENTENGMVDLEIVYDFVNSGDILGSCTSSVSFISVAREGDDGGLYVDFAHQIEFTSAQDNLEFDPMLAGVSAMYEQEGANSLDTLKWQDPEGHEHYLEIEEDEWANLDNWYTKYFSMGSWLEFRSSNNSWFKSTGDDWRIEVLETSRPDLDLSWRVVNTGNLFYGAENFWMEINFENHEGVLHQGESYSASLLVSTEMSENPWQEVIQNGFEDPFGWQLSGGAWVDPAGAAEIVERDKLAEGVAALRLEVADTNVWAVAELTNTFDCVGASQVQVSFWYETVNLDSTDTLIIELYDGTAWTQLQEMHAFLPLLKQSGLPDDHNANGWPRFQRITMAAGNQVFTDQMRIRFSLEASQVGAAVYVDDVKVLRTGQSAPITEPDFAFAGLTDQLALITPLGNDYDLDADPLTIVAVDSPLVSGSQAQWVDGSTFSYRTAPSYIGKDQVKYWVTDGTATNAATVSISAGIPNEGSNVYDADHLDAISGGEVIGGFVDNAHDSGDYFEWVFWVPFAGSYTLDFYAKSGVSYTLEVAIDGLVENPALSFGGDGWAVLTVSSLPVYLTGGLHTVRITTNGSSGSAVPKHQKMVVTMPTHSLINWDTLTYDPQELLPASFMAGIVNSGNQIGFSFDVAPTSTYRFETSESLVSPNWTSVTNMVPYALENVQLTLPITNSSGFYRLKETPFHY